jgi:CBS domain-containing protein
MMISHSLAVRTADFLIQHPPFSYLPRAGLEQLATQVKVRYYAENDFIFREGEPAGEGFFVLQKGRVEILRETPEGARLIDICDEGDPFGVRALISQNPYVASARVAADTLVYLVPREVFAPLLETHPRVALFFAAGFAAGQTVVRGGQSPTPEARRELLFQPHRPTGLFREEDVIVMKPQEKVIYCTPQSSLREAAQIMAEYRIGSIVVANETLHPVGILTDTDFTRKVAAGNLSIEAPVAQAMSAPVHTLPAGITVAKVILAMMRLKVRHLVITEDGTPQSPLRGIVSEHDVLLSQGNNPAVLVKRMLKARQKEALREVRDRAEDLIHNYLEQEISIPFITETMTQINDVLIGRAIALTEEALAAEGTRKPPLAYCWLSLGSEGRGEQLLRTDQDNALLYEDPPEELAAAAQAYFLALGQGVTDLLEYAGFAHCPGEIMASNPKWNQPLRGWKKHFTAWIRRPEPKALMHGTIFFDFRADHGDPRLAQALTDHLFAEVDEEPLFMQFFAQNALGNPPPLSFLKNLVVERGGKHKDQFDVKLRGMMPLADAARLLMLHHREPGLTNTVARFERLQALDPANGALYDEAAMAYEMLIRYRALNGFATQSSGRYLDLGKLNKIEKQTLKSAFRTIDDLQSLIKNRFSLTMFGG